MAAMLSPSKPTPDSSTILVVDDERVLVQVMRDELEMLGYRVLTAADGQKALGCYKQHKDSIDLVITDLEMPVMDGAELMAALRTEDPQVKVAVMTGRPDVIGDPTHPIHRADLVLAKPFHLLLFFELVFNLLGQ